MTYVGVCTCNRDGISSGSNTTVTLAFPAGAQVGDTFVGVVDTNAGSGTVTATCGANTWASDRGPDNQSNVLLTYLFERVLDATDIAAGAVTFTWTNGTRPQAMGNVFRGVTMTSSSQNQGVGSTLTLPSVTTTANGSDVAALVLTRVASGTAATITLPGTWTKDGTSSSAYASGANVNAVAGHLTTPGAAGTYGGGTITTSPAASHMLAYTVALEPTGGESHSGSASFTGSGQLSFSSAHPAFSRALALAGAGTLTLLASSVALSGSLPLSGTGSLSLTGAPAEAGSLALSGSGSLALSGSAVRTGSLALTGSGSLTFPAAAPRPAGLLALTVSGQLVVLGQGPHSGSLALAGHGALTLNGHRGPTAVAHLALPARTIDEILLGSHQAFARCRIIDRGVDTGVLLPIIGGSVQIDETRPVRRTSSLAVAGLSEWIPRVATDPLNPASGVELVPERGVRDDTGEIQWFSLGVFRPSDPSVGDDGSIDLSVACVDRADAVRRSLMLQRVVFSGGADVGLAIRTILESQAPWLPLDIPDAGFRLPSTTVVGGFMADPWEACQALARTLGADLRIDVNGIARLVPITDPLVAPVAATWAEGGSLLNLKRSWSASDLVNQIAVQWGYGYVTVVSDDTSPYGTASPIGKRPGKFQGDGTTIGSEAQARAVGMAELVARQGLAEHTTADVLVDPRRDAGDAVYVKRLRLGVDEVLRITQLTIPLLGAQMAVDFGARRVLT